jgi:hypothetical protein
MQSLSNIILLELQTNIDFMMKLKNNIQTGYFKVPDSFMYYLSAKYNISRDEFLTYEKQIIDLVMPIFTNTTPPKRPVVIKKRTFSIPPAEYQKVTQ